MHFYQFLTSFCGKTWRHREKSQWDARWALTYRLFIKKPRPSKTIRSQVIDQNVIFDLLMTLTLTFDLFYRFSIGIYSIPRGSHWPSLATIDSKLWPLEGEQTDKQTDRQTDRQTDKQTHKREMEYTCQNRRFRHVINWLLPIEHEFLDLELSDLDK